MSLPRRVLVTGGAGFIGSNFVRRLLQRDADVQVVVLDNLSYAGIRRNLEDVERDRRFRFVLGDIADRETVDAVATGVDAIVNFAAESHVDRSINEPDAFIRTDVYGTFVLLDAARRRGHERFLQVSTDEVYGDVISGSSKETDAVQPRSPYAASKASADLLVQAFHTTYDLPAVISRASNNFGPFQYPEKMIPLFVTNAIDGQPLPLYGDGQQIRDWLYVDDHCDALLLLLERGEQGEIYNVGGGNELTNLELTLSIIDQLGKPVSLVRFIEDRPGHDRRYSLDCGKLRSLGWRPAHDFNQALTATIEWYLSHQDWWRPIKEGSFRDYYTRQYSQRLASGFGLG